MTPESSKAVLRKLCEVEEEVTVLKAERDEAIRTRDEIHQVLTNLLCRIHRDGGHYVDEHGFMKAIADADIILSKLLSAKDL